jgi:hypothetical protein
MDALISVGTYVHDTAQQRIGRIISVSGRRVRLSPLGIGRPWEADAGVVRVVDWGDVLWAVQELAAKVRAGGLR